MDIKKQTKFAKDLQEFFPDVYDIYIYGRTSPWFWEAVRMMKHMKDSDSSGMIEVRYSNGNIDRVKKEEIVRKIN